MIGAAIRKDFLLLLRDRGALLSLFALPIVFMTAFGMMFELDDDRPRAIATWHAAGDPRGLAIAHALDAADGFAPAPHASAAAVRAAVADRRVDAGVVVTGEAVEIVIDPEQPVALRRALEATLQALVVRASVPPDALPRVAVAWAPGAPGGRDHGTSFQVAVPGNAVLFGFFLALTVALSVANERRTGTWRRVRAAPVQHWRALASLLVPYFCVGVCQLAFFFAVGVLAFDMQVAGSLAALAALAPALVYCAVSLGLLFAALGGSERQLSAFGSVALLVMGLLGGCMVPRFAMSPAMQSIGLAVPHGWAIQGYHDAIVHHGTTIADVAPSLAALFGFGTAFAVLGLVLHRFERV